MKFYFCLFIFLPCSAFAQVQNVSRFLEVGISPMAYKGDLSQGYQKWTAGFHVAIKNNKKKTLNGHFNLMFGTVSGQNPFYHYPSTATPNKFFKTNLFSVNYDLQYNLIKKDHFILYISQGIGLMRFSPKDENNDNLSNKINTRASHETFNNLAFFFPHSIGLMYFLKNNYGMGTQIGRFTPATDYIDNISQLSNYRKPDNVLMIKIYLLVPLSYRK